MEQSTPIETRKCQLDYGRQVLAETKAELDRIENRIAGSICLSAAELTYPKWLELQSQKNMLELWLNLAGKKIEADIQHKDLDKDLEAASNSPKEAA